MYCFVDYRISSEEFHSLASLGAHIIKIPKCKYVYEAINGHPDIQLNILNKREALLIIQKDMPNHFKKILDSNNIKYIVSKKSLSNTYPNDIFLNALNLKKHFIHNLKNTDKNLLELQNGKKLINVSQGYTKCSILPVREKALITSDKGIYNILKNHDFHMLLLPPGDILLPGLNYGFIGGTGGLITENTMAFFGNLNHYAYGKEVLNFLYKYDVKPVYLRNSKLIDRGSILTI